MSSINSLGIKLGNTNCRLACAFINEWSSLNINCLNGTADEQFATKTLFTVKANADYPEGFEQCLALAKSDVHPSNIVFDALNFKNSTSICYMDEEFGDIFANKQQNGKYKLEFRDENNQQTRIVEYQDIEVIAGILSKLMEAAKEQMPEKGAELQQIVITVPSLAEYEYKEKMLKVEKILSLPTNIDVQFMAQITAAAIAYRHKEGDTAEGNVLFFYMGARNTECSIYKFLDGQTPELLYADGILDFGGEDFTARLLDKEMTKLKQERWEKWGWKMDYEEKRTVYRNVRLAMEKIKEQLGYREFSTVKMDLGPTLHGGTFTITREEFEAICEEQCQKLELFLSSILSGFKEQINRIVLVGGSSKLYLVKHFFAKYSNNAKILPMNALAPELASVQGAAIKAAYETFKRNGNSLPKCLNKAFVPTYAFHGIYGTNCASYLPAYLVQFGQPIPTKNIPIKSFMDITWHEECGKNGKEIMKFKEKLKWKCEKYFAKIDKNGLLRFEHNDGEIWYQKDEELGGYIKRFEKYELDVMRVKKEQTEWEEKQREKRKLIAQQRQKKMEEMKQQEEAKKAAEELANKQKLDGENEKKNQKEIETISVIDKIGGGNEQKKSANLVVEQASEVIASDSNIVDVLIEIPDRNKSPSIYIKGSWDKWDGKIPMKYSQFTNSFLAVLSLPISKGEYEFLFVRENDEIWRFDEKYPNRNPPKTLNLNQYCRNWKVNFVELNSTTQNGNQNSSWTENKNMLEKILKADNSMVKLENRMNSYYTLKQYANNIKQKYLEIRNSLSKQLQINSQEVKALTDEADRAHNYLEIIIFVDLHWAKIERESKALKKCENAKKIRVQFMNMLQQTFTMEEAISHFRGFFYIPLLHICHEICLGEESMEIQQLKTFMDANFSHNNASAGTCV